MQNISLRNKLNKLNKFRLRKKNQTKHLKECKNSTEISVLLRERKEFIRACEICLFKQNDLDLFALVKFSKRTTDPTSPSPLLFSWYHDQSLIKLIINRIWSFLRFFTPVCRAHTNQIPTFM